MRVLIKFLSLTLVLLSSNMVSAQEGKFGLGIDVDDQLRIYMPIAIGNMIVEPMLLIVNNDRTSSDSSFQSNMDTKRKELGIGIFATKNLSNSTDIYYGARLGYIASEGSYWTSSSFGFPLTTSKSEEDGYFIAPTLGVQYHLSKDFTVGLDLSIFYSDVDGTSTNLSSGSVTSRSDTESSGYATRSKVILRYYF